MLAKLDPTLQAIFWMLVAILSFLGLMVGVRELSANLPVVEMLTLRSIVAFFILILCSRLFTNCRLKTEKFSLHIVRNCFHFTGQYSWAIGITLLPLAEVIAIEFTTPIWAVLLATLVLKEKLTKARALALIAGFIGVCIIVRPGFETIDSGIIVVFIATLAFAFTLLFSKQLTRFDSTWTILMYMAIIQFFIGIVPTAYFWVTPQGSDFGWIILIGVTGMTAHLGLTNALSCADTATILPIDFLRLPLTFLIGFIFYNESSDWYVLIGASIIFIANYYHIRSEAGKTRA